jgi:hypothetical protein
LSSSAGRQSLFSCQCWDARCFRTYDTNNGSSRPCSLRQKVLRCRCGASADLHLEHILQWRAEHIGPLAAAVGASLHAPLWNVPYKTLLHDLAASGVPCRVCATNGAVALGTRFDAALVAQLPAGTDAFGENGEFHTLAEVIGAPCMRVPPQHALFFELTVVIVHPGLGCAGWCGPFACIERAVGAAGPPKNLPN